MDMLERARQHNGRRVDVQRLCSDEWAAVWAYLAGEVSLQALGKARRPGKPGDATHAYPLLARALRELYAGGRILDTPPCALSAVVNGRKASL